MKIEIVDRRPVHVAYLRYTGPYGEPARKILARNRRAMARRSRSRRLPALRRPARRLDEHAAGQVPLRRVRGAVARAVAARCRNEDHCGREICRDARSRAPAPRSARPGALSSVNASRARRRPSTTRARRSSTIRAARYSIRSRACSRASSACRSVVSADGRRRIHAAPRHARGRSRAPGADRRFGARARPDRLHRGPDRGRTARRLRRGYAAAARRHLFRDRSRGPLAGCGGWSRRRTLFGSDARADRDAAELDPGGDAAKIRAFFIHPQFARRGFGSAMLLERCERDAMAHGFSRFELMGTLPGVRLYAARGYAGGARSLAGRRGLTIEFVPMSKTGAAAALAIERAVAPTRPPYSSCRNWPINPRRDSTTTGRCRRSCRRSIRCARTSRRPSCSRRCIDGALAGSVRARVVDDVCQVGRLIVQPQLQGRGIGTRLMRADRSRENLRKRARFELFTGSRSEGNIRLYERLGYRRCREQALSPGVTLVFMEKRR